jgi:outer membrane protein OmpA-like peptidoglycan-associated protein
MKSILAILSLLAVAACATANPPPELISARAAYADAANGPAQKYKPEELQKAKASLDAAEQSLKDDGAGDKTQTLAYVAEREAQTANAQGATAYTEAQMAQTRADYLKTTGVSLSVNQARAASGPKAVDLQAQTREAMTRLSAAGLAAKEEPRGVVITLSGSVLFASGKSTLLPAAQTKLNDVAAAIQLEPKHKILVEGYTDSQGAKKKNLDLSRQRAEAVRTYLISQGVSAALIEAVGLGEDHPVADNKTAAGRADNRRVEIIIKSLDTQAAQ